MTEQSLTNERLKEMHTCLHDYLIRGDEDPVGPGDMQQVIKRYFPQIFGGNGSDDRLARGLYNFIGDILKKTQ